MKTLLLILILASKISALPGFDVLRINSAVKYEGMGEAAVAVVDDANCIGINPAGLNYVKGNEVFITHLNYIVDMKLENITYGHRRKDNVFGLSISYFSVSGIEDIDSSGENRGEVSVGDIVLNIAYARKIIVGLESDLLLGCGLKFINSNLAEYSASGLGMDLGAQYKLELLKFYKGNEPNFALGLTIQNIGINLKKYQTENITLPLTLRFGIGYNFYKIGNEHKFRLSSDLIENFDKRNIGIGLQYSYLAMVYLRVGYVLGNGVSYFTSGIGGEYKTGKLTIVSDIAFILLQDLNNSYQFSIGAKF